MLINQNGEKITNYLYEDISYTKCGIYKVKLNCKSGYIDNNGTTIISIIYDYISDFAEGLSVCSIIDEKGYRKYGFIDINNKIIVPIIYDYAENYSDGVAIIKKMTDVNNGKKYYEYQVNKKGEILELKEYFEENIVETSDDYYESNNSYDNEEPNYAEDTWDAMTDGMYGDYPGGEVDYDNLGF